MMRAKQLLKILLPLVALTAMAVAAEPQLAEVTAVAQDGASLVTIRATGAFTHTEYRPAENLLLVDLVGVAAGQLEGREHKLQVPGVSGYRVVGYKGSSGAAVVRVELTLAANAGVSLSEETNALLVHVTSAGAAPAKAAAASVSAKDAPKPVASKPVLIQDVSVVRGEGGMNVEIRGSAPMQSKTMKLTNPDRVVVDVAGTPAGKGREIAVHDSQVKSVRVSHFQKDPAVTRVVVDLASAQDYEVVPEGNKLVVKLHAPANAAVAPAVAGTETKPAASDAAPAAPAAKMVAQDFVVIEPKDPSEAKSEPAAEEIRPGERAATAAAAFSKPETTLAATNLPQPANASLQPQPTVNLALQQQQQMAQTGGSSLPPKPHYTGEPISLNLKDADLKDFFRLIHEISGLNVVLDPNVKGTITIVLDDVPWDQALDIVLKNNNLERELDGNVLRIATVETLRKEAEGRKAQVEARDLAVNKVTITRYLSYAHATDLVPIIKKFLSSRGDVVADSRTNALIIEDIPSRLIGVEQRIRELDLKTPEVEIEARVVSATRSFARDIGTQLGFGWNNRVTTLGGASANTSPIVFNGGPGFLNLGASGIPLFSNLAATGATSVLGISTGASQTYRLDFALTLAESRGLLKILSRPRVVTQNNVKAEVKQGVRLPIVTQAQLSGPPTVTYVEAVLRLTVTPQITVENTIFLNIELANDTPDFSNSVQGNPSILTQSETTQVLVTDGGTVVIGGVIQTQNQVSIRQVPLLGNIPVFGNLFKQRRVSTTTQELIFFITPRIIQT